MSPGSTVEFLVDGFRVRGVLVDNGTPMCPRKPVVMVYQTEPQLPSGYKLRRYEVSGELKEVSK